MAQQKKNGRKGRQKVPAFRRKQKNILGITIGIITLVAASIVMFYGFTDLTEKRAELQQQAAELQEKIDEENVRTASLEEYETYTHTKKFAEETAKETLGYVYEDEIVFKLDE